MKTRNFISTFKSIVFNQRGEIGGDQGVAPPVEASSEPAEASGVPEEPAAEELAQESVLSEGEESAIEVQAETETELEEEIEQAVEDGASKEEVKEMIRKFTLKVDGKEFERELDLNDHEAIKAELQKAYKGQKTMQEKAEQDKMINNFLSNLEANPFETMKDLNPDFDEMAIITKYIEKLEAESQITPEEKEAMDRQKEYEELKAERDKLKQEKIDKEEQEKMSAVAAEIENDILSALQNDPDLIADKDTVALVAEELLWAANKGIQVDTKMVLPQVKKKLQQQFENYANRFKSTAALKQSVPSSFLEKLREDRIQQAQNVVKNTNSVQSVSKSAKDEEQRPKRKLSDLLR